MTLNRHGNRAIIFGPSSVLYAGAFLFIPDRQNWRSKHIISPGPQVLRTRINRRRSRKIAIHRTSSPPPSTAVHEIFRLFVMGARVDLYIGREHELRCIRRCMRGTFDENSISSVNVAPGEVSWEESRTNDRYRGRESRWFGWGCRRRRGENAVNAITVN